MRITPFALALYAVFATALALVLGYAAFTAAGGPVAPAQPHWIYGQKTQAATGQKDGTVVVCQAKTNSAAFGNRKHATPGDVYVMTCRAVRP